MLFKATRQGVVNVAQYYHHKTVQVRGTNDDIRSNVRGGLNIMEARNYRPERSVLLPSTSAASAPRKGQSNSTAGVKRSSSHPASDPVRHLQPRPVSLYSQIGYIGVSSFVTMERPSTRQAPDRLCLPHWRAALQDPSPCARQASSTDTSQSTIL